MGEPVRRPRHQFVSDQQASDVFRQSVDHVTDKCWPLTTTAKMPMPGYRALPSVRTFAVFVPANRSGQKQTEQLKYSGVSGV